MTRAVDSSSMAPRVSPWRCAALVVTAAFRSFAAPTNSRSIVRYGPLIRSVVRMKENWHHVRARSGSATTKYLLTEKLLSLQ